MNTALPALPGTYSVRILRIWESTPAGGFFARRTLSIEYEIMGSNIPKRPVGCVVVQCIKSYTLWHAAKTVLGPMQGIADFDARYTKRFWKDLYAAAISRAQPHHGKYMVLRCEGFFNVTHEWITVIK